MDSTFLSAPPPPPLHFTPDAPASIHASHIVTACYLHPHYRRTACTVNASHARVDVYSSLNMYTSETPTSFAVSIFMPRTTNAIVITIPRTFQPPCTAFSRHGRAALGDKPPCDYLGLTASRRSSRCTNVSPLPSTLSSMNISLSSSLLFPASSTAFTLPSPSSCSLPSLLPTLPTSSLAHLFFAVPVT